MPSVETVQGAVDAQELGMTLVHEHVRFRDEAVADAVAEPLRRAARAGRGARGGQRRQGSRRADDRRSDRDVRRARRALHEARWPTETGVRIVACTGIYSYDHLPHYFANRDVDVMADHFVEDIERGIQGTDIKAAFLKCAADAAGRDGERREDPPRGRARERADRRADHGALDAGGRHGARARSRSSRRRASTWRGCRSRTAATPTTSATSRG